MYDLGDAVLKNELVAALVGTLVDGRRATAQKFTAGSEDVVFDDGSLGQTKEVGFFRSWFDSN